MASTRGKREWDSERSGPSANSGPRSAETLFQKADIGRGEKPNTEPEVSSRGPGALDDSRRRASYFGARKDGQSDAQEVEVVGIRRGEGGQRNQEWCNQAGMPLSTPLLSGVSHWWRVSKRRRGMLPRKWTSSRWSSRSRGLNEKEDTGREEQRTSNGGRRHAGRPEEREREGLR